MRKLIDPELMRQCDAELYYGKSDLRGALPEYRASPTRGGGMTMRKRIDPELMRHCEAEYFRASGSVL